MKLSSGEVCTALTYRLGDTLCGLILEEGRRVATISDASIEPTNEVTPAAQGAS